jgi:Rrf2 family nitric oxide-sensitive transcriptional repressor
MRLNKSTNDAIQILMECARSEGTLVKVADLSARLGITMQNVFKIVHILSRSSLIVAVRGRHGGVRLARAAADIRIGEVVRAMETMGDVVSAGGPRGTRRATPMAAVIDDALEAFITVLDQHTLAEMAKASQARGGAPAKRKPARAASVGRGDPGRLPPGRARTTG